MKKKSRTNYSWIHFPERYPKPESDGVAEYQARLARERSAAAAQARAQEEAEEAARARAIHEVRVQAGRKGAAARWAGHKKVKPIPPKRGSSKIELAALIIGVIGGVGASFRDLIKRRKNNRLQSCSMHLYEVRPRSDKRDFDLIGDALPFGRLWYGGPNASQQRNRLRKVSQPLR
jgi:hypothetical protein